jgi:leucyl aminopeptidase
MLLPDQLLLLGHRQVYPKRSISLWMDSPVMKISFAKPALPKSGAFVVVVEEGGEQTDAMKALDKASRGQIFRAIKAQGFTGKKEQNLLMPAAVDGLDLVMLMGVGKGANLTAREIELLGGAITGTLMSAKCKLAHVSPMPGVENAATLLASGARLRHYAFDRYKSKKKDTKGLENLAFQTVNPVAAQKGFSAFEAVAEGNHFARDLVNEPANVLTPVVFADRARTLTKAGVKVEIFTPEKMKKLGMGALLGVGQGSANPPRMVVLRWDGGKKGAQPIAFIGKGVTFDTGGVSIKPAAGMEDMKGDMAGAACVTGLMLALAKRKAKVNVIGAIGLVENAIDGNAQRPGDIVTSMSGQTIAVLNTDAEGRLVLADVLWYIQDRFKPKFMVNLATLTGAIMVALGKEYAGLFSNNDELSARLFAAGNDTGERVWRMPLAPEYDKLIDHDVADMKNIGGRFGGSITAAQFLQRFVNSVPWAHLDVAGTAMDAPKTPISQSWANGWGVRLLNKLVAEHYES